MPEIAEVKLTSDFINKYSGKIFNRIEKSPVSKIKTDLGRVNTKFTVHSSARGKEMVIDLTPLEEPGIIHGNERMKINLGMSGMWIYYDPTDTKCEKYHKHAHLRFVDEKGYILGLCDTRRFAKWVWGDFDKKRGPCPLSEPRLFRDDLMENWYSHKDFRKGSLSVILLNQRWFNGVGNYLRAEILYRLDRNPFMVPSELESKDLEKLIDLTINCCNQAYKLGGGQLKDWKNPNGEDPSSFKEWMKCYGIMEKMIDKSGRTFWYDKKWK